MECQEFTALVEFTRKSATDSSDKKWLEEVELKANIMQSKFEKFDELPTELQFETDKVYQP